jgi:hypothetical protein
MRRVGHVVRTGLITANKILVGKHEKKNPLGAHTRRGYDNIKIDIKKCGHMSMWTGFIWLSTGHSEHGNKLLSSI